MVLDSRSRVDSSEAINSNGATSSNNASNNGSDATVATVTPISIPTAPSAKKNLIGNWWQALGLQTKATIVAIAAITIPLVAVGGFSYYYVAQDITRTTKQNEAILAKDMGYRVAYFMR
ncbi:MAG: methyl-accepting chemotaxis protein, partial [Pseudanabaena sp.]